VIVGSVLYGADEFIAQFVTARIQQTEPRVFGHRDPVTGELPYKALGVVRSGVLLGGIVFYNYYGHSIEAGMAFDRADWARPSTLRRLFAYPYFQLGVVRCTVMTGRKNRRTRQFLDRLGFKVEGVIRKGANGVEDAILYGLLRHEISWLMERKTETNEPTIAAANS